MVSSTQNDACLFRSAFKSDNFVIHNKSAEHVMQERDELMCWLATVGATSGRGRRILQVSSGAEFDGFEAALVGSRLSSGDKIATAPQLVCDASKKEGMTIPGLFEPGYVPPSLCGAGSAHA
ncbi:hypothetical protein [Caballeronia glebae]|uniref:hypothetical protein n=1 Tax=Caballeronia glebae TaxID=1777143 RepID=UPI0038B6E058